MLSMRGPFAPHWTVGHERGLPKAIHRAFGKRRTGHPMTPVYWCIRCGGMEYAVGPAITHEYHHPEIRQIGTL